jgi:FkbM family methyltransferase
MYFTNDLITLEDEEVLLDCGAFVGDSADCFLKAMQSHAKKPQRIYCFEPDETNFAKLDAFMAGRGDMSAHKIGLWNEPGQLNFSSLDMMFSSEAGIVQPASARANDELVIVKADGDCVIRVDTIDALLQGSKASLIKMDIEGSEAQALEGARETLQKWKPKLVISAYHKRSDIYELALLIRRLNPAYRIYLRQFSFSLSELVLIAL